MQIQVRIRKIKGTERQAAVAKSARPSFVGADGMYLICMMRVGQL
jgi:hypothetical protein